MDKIVWIGVVILVLVIRYAAAGPYITISAIKTSIVEKDSEKSSENSVYRLKVAANTDAILTAALCPNSLFADDYDLFVEERAGILSGAFAKLIA